MRHTGTYLCPKGVVVSERRTPDMLVVLDSDPNSLAPLTIAQRYAAGTVLLTSWAADPLEVDAVVQATAASEPTVSEALQAAAQRGMPWIGLRRDFAPPERLLCDLLIATARHSTDVVPGFAVFLADGEPPPFRHILAIVDRSDGPLSGLLAYAAVAVADTADAHLDILVIGDAGENLHTEDELETLVINREQELYDAAVERARAQELSVTWITAASRDLWKVVSDQISQHDYDLVIDDLGDVSLARLGLRTTVRGTLADGAAGEIPLKLLTQTTLPILLVMDEIRLGLASPGLLKAGAMAALALGMVAAPIAAAAATTAPATVTSDEADPVEELISELESALGVTTEEAAEEARAQEVEEAARGSADGARGEAEQVATQTTAYAPQATVATSGTQSAAATAESQGKAEDKSAAEPKPPKPPKPPKGGATPSQVAKAKAQAAKAKAQAAEAKAAFEKDKAKRAKAEQTVAETEAALVEAQEAAQAALADLEAATASHAEAVEIATSLESSATGLKAMLPGTPTAEEVAAADLAAQMAADSLAASVASGEEALAAMQSAEEALAEEAAKVEKRAAAAEEAKAAYKEAKAAYDVSKEKAELYKESLAETRQSPVAKGSYRLTARFGQTGGYWSSGVHTGLDFAGSNGTSIMAAASGTVVSTGYEGAYGNQVIIDHGNGLQSTYNHLSGVSVSAGAKVSTGDKIGSLGSTGNSTGPHLHFEVTKNGKFIDPEGWLGW